MKYTFHESGSHFISVTFKKATETQKQQWITVKVRTMKQISVEHIGEHSFVYCLSSFESLKRRPQDYWPWFSGLIHLDHMYTSSLERSCKSVSLLNSKHSVGQKHQLLAFKIRWCTRKHTQWSTQTFTLYESWALSVSREERVKLETC